MATSINIQQLGFTLKGSYRKTNNFAGGLFAPFSHDWAITLANGTGAGFSNFMWQSEFTIAATLFSTIDLRALPDEFGTTQTVTKVALFAIRYKSNSPTDTTGTLSVGNGGANSWTGICGTAASLLSVRYQGFHIFLAQDATKFATSAGSKDVKILNNSATAVATVDVLVVGEI